MMNERKLKAFLQSIGEAGQFADEVSDMILFHLRVMENAKKRYL